MRITFLGGADEVGASSILIEVSGKRLLFDAGIRPSPKARYGLQGDQLPDLSQVEQAGGLDAILVTHAHTDHTGALELVAGHYPGVPVYATPPTIALVRVLHQDARRIMQSRLEEEGELPLFDDLAVERLLSAFVPAPFNTRLPLGEGLVATFYPAGHIAGAAMIGLESDEGRILVSGDIALSPQRTVSAARLPPIEPDVLILESTYGGRLHANRLVQERKLVERVNAVVSAGGKVLIPAFALGRAQEILLILNEYQRRSELLPVPIWADGMVRAICQAYTTFPDSLPLTLQERGAEFFGGYIQPVQNNQQRNALLWQPEPLVIVSSSGMLAGGPALNYARALAGQPQHAILLTGYQDEESPGRRLQEMAERGRGTLWLGKDKVDVQCSLGTYSLSAHADEGQLISLVETLNPGRILLVHGDEQARTSLGKALEARQRSVLQPHAGQSFEFQFTPAQRSAPGGIGESRPVDIQRLWQATTTESGEDSAGGYFQLAELARAWWGETQDAKHLEELRSILAQDDLYFLPDSYRPDLYRLRPPSQVEITRKRRARLAELSDLPGQWVALKSNAALHAPNAAPRLARCTALARDYFWVTGEEGEPERAWPEDLLHIFGTDEPSAVQLAALSPGGLVPVCMEPNQALALANQQFPAAARLRRSGYRLEQRILLLTFDFPDSAREFYAPQIADLETRSGWKVEIAPEANQSALFSLAQEVLPSGWRILKGPALHRQNKRIAITTWAPSSDDIQEALRSARQRFTQESGFQLEITLAAAPPPAQSTPTPPADLDNLPAASAPWEINAAYTAIKTALEGSTLYRTSLKGSEIVLSFISRQVGERYQAQIAALERQTGWRLSINPQPNQGAILETARSLLGRAGWQATKGPGIYPEKADVAVTLAAAPEETLRSQVTAEFEQLTGFRLALSCPPSPPPGAGGLQPKSAAPVTHIPVARIRLRRYHQELALDPGKLEKAIERARRLGQINPPIQVRRLADSYLLLDGLYRLKAAQALGLEQIPAEIE